MREILFRGKCKETGKWYVGNYINLHKTTYCFKEDYERDKDNDLHYIVFEEMMDWGLPNRHLRVDIIPETIGQYTGLTDKNGNKIFEGDIARCKYANTPKNEHIQKVVFEGGKFMAEFLEGGCYAELYNGATRFSFDKSVYMTEIEIIGNIHDNPELLGGVDE